MEKRKMIIQDVVHLISIDGHIVRCYVCSNCESDEFIEHTKLSKTRPPQFHSTSVEFGEMAEKLVQFDSQDAALYLNF